MIAMLDNSYSLQNYFVGVDNSKFYSVSLLCIIMIRVASGGSEHKEVILTLDTVVF
jgi:hypothetical protein